MAGDFFQKISLVFDTNLLSSVNDVIASGLSWARPQVRAAATLFILISGWLVLTGRMDKNVLAGRVLRIMAVAALLTSAGTFNTYVRDLFLQDIPSTVGAALTGGTTYAPAAQFDALWSATQRIAATMLAEATGYTQFGERLVIRGLMGVSFVALVVIFLMWVVARVLMGFVIALGPFLIGLYLFDATRPYVDRWVGKLVSLTLVQVSVSVMLQMLMTGFNTYVRAAQANPGGSLDEKIGAFLQVGAWYWCGLFLIASLTVVAYSIGGGLAASFAPLTQSAAGMTNGAASLAGTGVGAGGKALGRGIGRGVAAGYRRMRSSSNTHAAE
ncbi:type IV secretion system protein [Roseomonas sp. NAR14]|uniref:Type IV secretion system protein n=1 Tax=Roseomonas acroporae TaxID=2937791 RepID=A0A9X2BZA7_9PROT|nr:type IV secretion system protein [Roseomonas mucosa]MCG7352880.1 type IV secretion system protein [Roseomonas mucosa]MCG7356140.1 type IV secretion system protein [Roseomonas mucosa]MCK8786870.1 type IV secretion system protein [Roseomonas acroporae]MDT8294198.1 type IV secretion system protein [Roseomonas mucosa]